MAALPARVLTRSQYGFVTFCICGFLASLLAWFVNLDVACRHFLGAGFLLQALPGYRFLAALAVDITTISTALPLVLFWLPLRAYRRLRPPSHRVMPYPRNFFVICTYAGLTGTLLGVMIAFWQGAENLSPLEQAKSLFGQLTVGLPTAIVSTLTGILVPAASHYITKWYCAAFAISNEQSSPLTIFYQSLQQATAAINLLVSAIGGFKQACGQSATTAAAFVARTNELNSALCNVTKNLDAFWKKGPPAMDLIDRILASNNRVVEAIRQSTSASGQLANAMQSIVLQLSKLDASVSALRTESSADAAKLKKQLDELPSQLAKAITEAVQPLSTTLAANRQVLANVGRALFSEQLPSPPLVQEIVDAKRNGHATVPR